MAPYDYCKSCVIGITAALCIYTLILVLFPMLLELNENKSNPNESTLTSNRFFISRFPRNESMLKNPLFRKDVNPPLLKQVNIKTFLKYTFDSFYKFYFPLVVGGKIEYSRSSSITLTSSHRHYIYPKLPSL